jgi:pimeloyl-ACP methyl ester carboxylesterase
VGHSDGGSIAIIYAGSHYTADLKGLILLAPHIFNETICIESIRQAGVLYRETDLSQRLARYHDDVENTFWGWHDVWLTPEFLHWNIEPFLDNIHIPVLLIQGENDQYGTLAQVNTIHQKLPPPVQRLVLSDCRHSPHQDQPEMTRDHLVDFVNYLVFVMAHPTS